MSPVELERTILPYETKKEKESRSKDRNVNDPFFDG